jgi:hypothetical protein
MMESMIYAYVAENPVDGVKRGLFWSLYVTLPRCDDTEPDGDEESDSFRSFIIDGLAFPLRRWQELYGLSLANAVHLQLIQCSAYRDGEHHDAVLEKLQFLPRQDTDGFTASISMRVPPIRGLTMSEAHISITTELRFDGIFIVPANLNPAPCTPQEVSAMVAAFADLDGYEAPVWDRFRYVMRPAKSHGQ